MEALFYAIKGILLNEKKLKQRSKCAVTHLYNNQFYCLFSLRISIIIYQIASTCSTRSPKAYMNHVPIQEHKEPTTNTNTPLKILPVWDSL